MCDISYNAENIKLGGEDSFKPVASKWGQFTDPCLQRGGVIVAATVGKELENSNWNNIPEDTMLVLAHNLALPHGEKGKIFLHFGIFSAIASIGNAFLPLINYQKKPYK